MSEPAPAPVATATRPTPRLLIVDDEQSVRDFLRLLFEDSGYAIQEADSVRGARRLLDRLRFDVALCDLKMPDGSGLDLLREIRAQDSSTSVILMTAHGSHQVAVEAMKAGAYDYVAKPFEVDELKVLVEKAFERVELVDENARLRQELAARYTFAHIIGRSGRMQKVFEMVRRVADNTSTVLLTGESGTGKELIARAIHHQGPRARGRFLSINCGALPENLLESELFGHEKGAYTGAHSRSDGLFHAASGGTLLLDEIGEMTPAMQVKLLRVLQEKTVRRVGGNREEPVDVRILAATHRDLKTLVESGSFREDLYYRVHVIPIPLPALRQRPEDIPLLTEHFLQKYSAEMGVDTRRISPSALHVLEAYSWPGNVRELENVVERAVALATAPLIGVRDLPHHLHDRQSSGLTPASLPEEGMDIEAFLDDQRRHLMLEALERADGVQTHAAELLGMTFRSFRYYASKLGIAGG